MHKSVKVDKHLRTTIYVWGTSILEKYDSMTIATVLVLLMGLVFAGVMPYFIFRNSDHVTGETAPLLNEPLEAGGPDR